MYGTLRPDDDSNAAWTKPFNEGEGFRVDGTWQGASFFFKFALVEICIGGPVFFWCPFVWSVRWARVVQSTFTARDKRCTRGNKDARLTLEAYHLLR